jgi:DsbC/DsbD-like thiol-disulfide interchange protein
MMGTMSYRFLFLSVLLGLLIRSGERMALAAGPAASDWHETAHARLRLIAARLPYQGRMRTVAGIDILLEPGWKTYWRSPGDGLAPTIDWQGSANLKSANVLWPAPTRFDEPGGLVSIGYKDGVLLPVLITPAEAGLPVDLAVHLHIGVCKEICIPVEMTLRLEIGAVETNNVGDALKVALDKVPKQQSRGVYCPHAFITAKRRVVNGKSALVIKTAYDDEVGGRDLFAEAPDGTPLPMPVKQPESTRGRSHYLISFDSEEAEDALKGQTLILTSVSDQGSCETTWHME